MKFSPILLALAWVLGSWKGYLALFDPGAEEPRQIWPVLVEALPEADRLALEEGITIRGKRRLDAMLEDYLS